MFSNQIGIASCYNMLMALETFKRKKDTLKAIMYHTNSHMFLLTTPYRNAILSLNIRMNVAAELGVADYPSITQSLINTAYMLLLVYKKGTQSINSTNNNKK